MSESVKIQNQIDEAEAGLRRLRDEREKIRARLAYLEAEVESLDWPITLGDEKATSRRREAGAEIDSLRLALAERESKIEAGEIEIRRLREALVRAQLAEAMLEAAAAELAYHEARLALLDLRVKLREAERACAAAGRELDRIARQVRSLGGQHPGAVPLMVSDEAAPGVHRLRIDELRKIAGGLPARPG